MSTQDKLSPQEKFSVIQKKMIAPKGAFNDFGKYYYRRCEDILHALKNLDVNFSFIVNLSDDLVLIGDRYYIKAIASVTVDNITFESTSFARETDHKKGMDDAQVTGASSSYARKYALSGLLGLDDEKDPDTQPPQDKKPSQEYRAPKQQSFDGGAIIGNPISQAQSKAIYAICMSKKIEVPNTKEWSSKQASDFIKELNAK